MDQDRFDRIKDLYLAAVRLEPEARAAFLAGECGGDEKLLADVSKLLKPVPDDDILDSPAHEGLAIAEVSILEDAPPRGIDFGVGNLAVWDRFLEQLRSRGPTYERYRDEGELARGGMGIVRRVYDEDVRRELAMKVMLDSEELPADGEGTPADRSLGRFLEEAQVTGQLDHPGIVPVHEVGVDGDGRVYFTMKLVLGDDLRVIFARVHRGDSEWTTTRALNVMLRVCEAMAYAHAKGVIHRDLKPANVMVGRFGEAYVMDWGLARVLDQPEERDLRIRRGAADEDAGSPLVTMDGDVIGTPSYMPPEQAEGRIQDLSPRSDVYAAGAMLYHLLCGRPPYADPEQGLSPHAVLARVLQEAPEPVAGLSPESPPELVAICERAMERRARARYDSMEELASDLRAYLEQRVVKAYATGPVAELKKWVARNRGVAASLAAVLALAIAAGLLLAWQQEQSAVAIAKERDVAQAVADFQREMLSIDAWEDGSDVTALELVDRAAGGIEVAYAGQPETEAAVRRTIGNTYSSLGDYEKAVTQLSRAVEFYRREFGDGNPRTMAAVAELARALRGLGKHQGAADLQRELLEQTRLRLGDAEPNTATAMGNLALTLTHLGEYEEAEAIQREQWEIARRLYGDEHPEILVIMNNLGATLIRRGEYEEAEELHREVYLQRKQQLGEDDALTLNAKQNLAATLREAGSAADAEPLLREVLGQRRSALGENHPSTLISQSALARALSGLRRHEEAANLRRDLLERRTTALGDLHPSTLDTTHDLGLTLANLGELEEAESLLRKALTGLCEARGAEHPNTLSSMNVLATILRRRGRYPEAEELLREVKEIRSRTLGEDHPSTLTATNNLATTLHFQKRYAEAEPLQSDLVRRLRRAPGDNHPLTLKAMGNHGSSLIRLERMDEAIDLLRERLDRSLSTLGEEHGDSLGAAQQLAYALHIAGRSGEAEPLRRRERDLSRKKHGESDIRTLTASYWLARALIGEGRLDEAEALVTESLPICDDELGDTHPASICMRLCLIEVRLGGGQLIEAIDQFRNAIPLAVNQPEPDPLLVDHIDRTATLHPSLRLEYGRWFAGRGMFEKAERWLLRAEEEADDPTPARQALLELYEDWGRGERAELYRARLDSDSR